MQLMIDLDDALESSHRAEVTIAMLRTAADLLERSSIVQNSRTKSADVPSPPAAPSNIVNFPKPTAPTAPAQLEVPPPPPAPLESSSSSLQPGSSLPVAPPSNLPIATAPSTPSPPVEFDSAGVPFDDRIHQKKRGQKTDGSWKLQKGIDPAIVQRVISELSASGKMRPLDAPPPPSANVPSPPSSEAASVFGKSPLPASAAAPSPPINEAPPPPPPSDAMPTVTFRALVARFAAATKDGKLTPQEVQGICQQHGAPTLMALNSMAHLVPDVSATLDAALLMKG